MFRRFAEHFYGGEPHATYMADQQSYFGALPNMIASGTPGLKGFDNAIQTVDNDAKNYLPDAVKNPDDIFLNPETGRLKDIASQCRTSSLDDLIRTRDPAAKYACGWLYSPPPNGSPYPTVSAGALGSNAGPVPDFNNPSYKQWFFNLQAAKKQLLMDKCKALKDCNSVDNDPYKGNCGYCTDTNQGIPIDANGSPLYPNDPRGNCSPDALVKSRGQCPPPPPPAAGPQPIVDRTCDPIDGKLSTACLRRQLTAAGCSNNGSLMAALRAPARTDDYIAGIRDSDSMKMYMRTANPPINMDIFKQGQATIDQVLKEVRTLAGQATKPGDTGLGSSARDLCLNAGAISGYDPCLELSDGAPAPFLLECLRQLFLKMGGQPAGRLWPTEQNTYIYNQQGNWGGVKRFLQQKAREMKGGDNFVDYNTQRAALTDILGIIPEQSIRRAPYYQGVEIFWFAANPWSGIGRVGAFLKRTIERDIKQFPPGPSNFPGIGGRAALLQLTDVRAQAASSMKFAVNVDDGFYITINQPAKYDATALQVNSVDKPGHFANMNWQGPTWYQSNTCIPINATMPNIAKFYFIDGGGWMSFVVKPQVCSGPNSFDQNHYSITCEKRAPFINFEVTRNGVFEETRSPAIFGQLINGQRGMVPSRWGEISNAPSGKPYVSMNGAQSVFNVRDVCFSSWKTVSAVMRFKSMPVKESIFNLAFERIGGLYFNLVAVPVNGSQAAIQVEHNLTWINQAQPTAFRITLDRWYIFYIHNNGTGFDVCCNSVDDAINSGGNTYRLSFNHNGPMFAQYGYWGMGQACDVHIGSNGFVGSWAAMYGSAAFNYDLLSLHFFDHYLTNDDVLRECKSDWIYTDFPSEYNKYN
jgi:hypothetical protein